MNARDINYNHSAATNALLTRTAADDKMGRSHVTCRVFLLAGESTGVDASCPPIGRQHDEDLSVAFKFLPPFCDTMNIVPVPASEQTVAHYAAYLARRLKPASVKQYLNVIRMLHFGCAEPHPYKDTRLVIRVPLVGSGSAEGAFSKGRRPYHLTFCCS